MRSPSFRSNCSGKGGGTSVCPQTPAVPWSAWSCGLGAEACSPAVAKPVEVGGFPARAAWQRSPLFLCGRWPPSRCLGRMQTLLPKAATSAQGGELCIQGELLQDGLLLTKPSLGLDSAWDSPSSSSGWFGYFL